MGLMSVFNDGMSMPANKTFGQRIALKFGYFLASHRKNVTVDKSAMISPDAMINARGGRIIIGEKACICPGAVVQGRVSFGKNCSVQPYSILVGYGTDKDSSGEIIIGDNVRIASHCMIIGANHIYADPNRTIHSQGLERKSIVIEDDVWVCGRVSIVAGVTVGKGSVLAAGAVVTKDVPPYSVVGGVPAKFIKSRG